MNSKLFLILIILIIFFILIKKKGGRRSRITKCQDRVMNLIDRYYINDRSMFTQIQHFMFDRIFIPLTKIERNEYKLRNDLIEECINNNGNLTNDYIKGEIYNYRKWSR